MEWISVKDRLPEKDESVLVWPEIGGICIASISGKTFNGRIAWYTTDGDCTFYSVSHWMPLPEPPSD